MKSWQRAILPFLLVMYFCLVTQASAYTLSGVVRDDAGTALSDANVYIIDPSSGNRIDNDIADENGNYSISLVPGTYDIGVHVWESSNSEPWGYSSIDINPLIVNLDISADTIQDITIPPLGTATVSGYTKDSNGVAVGDVMISANSCWNDFSLGFESWRCSNASIYSDQNGAYSFIVPPGGAYTVRITPPAGSGLAELLVNGFQVNGDMTHDFVLPPGFTLSGVVRDDAGIPLFDAEVMIFDPVNGDWLTSAYSDPNGNYSITLVPGTYDIGLFVWESSDSEPWGNSSININPLIANLDISADTIQDITIALARVSGYTKDSNGVAVGNVMIVTHNCWPDFSPGFESWRCSDTEIYSDQNGAYSFIVLSGGAYTVRITPPDGSGLAELLVNEFQVNGDMTHDFVLLPGFTLSGVVRDGAGTTLSGAEVMVIDPSTGDSINSVYTDGNGNYSISLVPDTYDIGVYVSKDLTVNPPFWSSYSFNINPIIANLDISADTIQDITIPSLLATVSGYTNDSNGNAVGNVRISANSCWNDSSLGFNSQRCSYTTIYSDQNGAYSFLVLPGGAYTVNITPPDGSGLAESLVNEFQVNGDMTHDFILLPGFTLSGVVRDDTGTELSNSWVYIIDPASGELIGNVYTYDTGNYSLTLVPGTYNIRVYVSKDLTVNPPFWSSYSFNINPLIANLDVSADTVQDLTIPSLATVSGYTKDSNGNAVGNVSISANSCWNDSSLGFDSQRCSYTTIYSDQNGAYSFFVLPGGVYTINITPPDGSGFAESVVNDFPINGDMTHDFVLPQGFTLSGVVRDDEGTPLGDAEVYIYDASSGDWIDSVIADDTGSYSITLVPGTYNIHVYLWKDLTVDPSFSSHYSLSIEPLIADLDVTADTVQDITIPLATVSGYTKDSNGAVVGNVRIFANSCLPDYSLGFESWRCSDVDIYSDQNGAYSFTVFPGGAYSINITPPDGSGLAELVMHDFPINGDMTHDFVIPQGVLLSGVVRDDEGIPLGGVEVRIVDPVSGVVLHDVTTDDTGNYSISLVPGTYNIDVYVFKYLTYSPFWNYYSFNINPLIVNLDVTADTVQDITIPLATVNGYTKDGNGAAVGNVKIEASGCWTDSSPGFQSWSCSNTRIYSDQNGAYSFTVLPGGAYTIYITPPDGSGLAGPVVNDFPINGDMTHDFVLPQGVTLSGVVRDGAGTPLGDAEVRIVDSSNGELIKNVRSDDTGNYSISLVPGTYDIDVNYSKYLTYEPFWNYYSFNINPLIVNLDVTADTVQDITIPLATVSGYTKDSNGLAVGNVRIFANSCWIDSSPGFDSERCSYVEIYSEQNGAYSFTVLPGGAYYINITPPEGSGLAGPVVNDFPINGDMTHDFVLPQAVTLSGVVRDDEGTPLGNADVAIVDPSSGDWIDSVTADDTGNYSITLVPGTYNIYVLMWKDLTVDPSFSSHYSFSFEPLIADLDVSENTVQDITIPLATVSGYTKDSNGAAVGNVRIFANSCWTDSSLGFDSWRCSDVDIYSDQNGAYSFIVLSGGVYTIYITPPDGSGFTESVVNDFPINEDMTHDFVLTLEGVSDVDEDGFPDDVEEAAQSNPLDPNSIPGDSELQLRTGYNQVSFPAETMHYGDLQTLMAALGGSAVIEKVLVFDQATQQYIEAKYAAGVFEGTNLGLPAGQGLQGMIIYAKQEHTVNFTSQYCHTWDLQQGFNLVGSGGCLPAGLTAQQLLDDPDLGATNVSSIQRFNPDTGEFETRGFDDNGNQQGDDFFIIPSEGYLLHMKQAVPDFAVVVVIGPFTVTSVGQIANFADGQPSACPTSAGSYTMVMNYTFSHPLYLEATFPAASCANTNACTVAEINSYLDAAWVDANVDFNSTNIGSVSELSGVGATLSADRQSLAIEITNGAGTTTCRQFVGGLIPDTLGSYWTVFSAYEVGNPKQLGTYAASN